MERTTEHGRDGRIIIGSTKYLAEANTPYCVAARKLAAYEDNAQTPAEQAEMIAAMRSLTCRSCIGCEIEPKEPPKECAAWVFGANALNCLIAEVSTLRHDIRQLREAIAIKGGDENYPTEEAYLKACTALNKQHDENRTLRVKPAEYKQAEKDGRMVVLPCKPGDTVYMIGLDREIEQYFVIEMVYDGEWHPVIGYDGDRFAMGMKDVYLTREAAEAAMKGDTK